MVVTVYCLVYQNFTALYVSMLCTQWTFHFLYSLGKPFSHGAARRAGELSGHVLLKAGENWFTGANLWFPGIGF